MDNLIERLEACAKRAALADVRPLGFAEEFRAAITRINELNEEILKLRDREEDAMLERAFYDRD